MLLFLSQMAARECQLTAQALVHLTQVFWKVWGFCPHIASTKCLWSRRPHLIPRWKRKLLVEFPIDTWSSQPHVWGEFWINITSSCTLWSGSPLRSIHHTSSPFHTSEWRVINVWSAFVALLSKSMCGESSYLHHSRSRLRLVQDCLKAYRSNPGRSSSSATRHDTGPSFFHPLMVPSPRLNRTDMNMLVLDLKLSQCHINEFFESPNPNS